MRQTNKVLADLPVELTIYNKTVAYLIKMDGGPKLGCPQIPVPEAPKKNNIIGQTKESTDIPKVDPYNTPTGRCLHGAYKGYCPICK